MNLKDELEHQRILLAGELDLTIEATQEILDLHRKQFDRLTETYSALLAQNFKDEEQ